MKTFKTAYVLASKTKLQHHTEYFLVSLGWKSGQLAKQWHWSVAVATVRVIPSDRLVPISNEKYF